MAHPNNNPRLVFPPAQPFVPRQQTDGTDNESLTARGGRGASRGGFRSPVVQDGRVIAFVSNNHGPRAAQSVSHQAAGVPGQSEYGADNRYATGFTADNFYASGSGANELGVGFPGTTGRGGFMDSTGRGGSVQHNSFRGRGGINRYGNHVYPFSPAVASFFDEADQGVGVEPFQSISLLYSPPSVEREQSITAASSPATIATIAPATASVQYKGFYQSEPASDSKSNNASNTTTKPDGSGALPIQDQQTAESKKNDKTTTPIVDAPKESMAVNAMAKATPMNVTAAGLDPASRKSSVAPVTATKTMANVTAVGADVKTNTADNTAASMETPAAAVAGSCKIDAGIPSGGNSTAQNGAAHAAVKPLVAVTGTGTSVSKNKRAAGVNNSQDLTALSSTMSRVSVSDATQPSAGCMKSGPASNVPSARVEDAGATSNNTGFGDALKMAGTVQRIEPVGVSNEDNTGRSNVNNAWQAQGSLVDLVGLVFPPTTPAHLPTKLQTAVNEPGSTLPQASGEAVALHVVHPLPLQEGEHEHVICMCGMQLPIVGRPLPSCSSRLTTPVHTITPIDSTDGNYRKHRVLCDVFGCPYHVQHQDKTDGEDDGDEPDTLHN